MVNRPDNLKFKAGEQGDISSANSASWLERLRGVWRDIAGTFSGSVRADLSNDSDILDLREQMENCLEARGGEVSARARAASLGETYLGLDMSGRRRFLQLLASSFQIDKLAVSDAISEYTAAKLDDIPKAVTNLRMALEPRPIRLLTQFNALPQGVKFLVDMRSDLLSFKQKDPFLKAFEYDFQRLLTSWFDIGFLKLERISWDHPASLLEKLIEYEAVHEMRGWGDLKNRLDADRRCFAFFHPRMPDEPLIFVQVALLNGLAESIDELLDPSSPTSEVGKADTAIFYSISNAQSGLEGISFGGFLIKRVVDLLRAEFPALRQFATLSPMPGFRKWFEESLGNGELNITPSEMAGLLSASEEKDLKADGYQSFLMSVLNCKEWYLDEANEPAVRLILMRAASKYLACCKRKDGIRALDPVANFHLTNGARIERLNWLADKSENGMKNAAGLMVNYLYDLERIEANHEAYSIDGKTALSPGIKRLLKS